MAGPPNRVSMNQFSMVARLVLPVLALGQIAATARASQGEVPYRDFLFRSKGQRELVRVGQLWLCLATEVAKEHTDWRPYAEGFWSQTDQGWTWVSYEDFGWATFHYGRWARLADAGWVWVPGFEWAPAWVSWRASPGLTERSVPTATRSMPAAVGVEAEEIVGWAPLPPEAAFNFARGFSPQVDFTYQIGPDFYNFVPARSFGERFLRPWILRPSANEECLAIDLELYEHHLSAESGIHLVRWTKFLGTARDCPESRRPATFGIAFRRRDQPPRRVPRSRRDRSVDSRGPDRRSTGGPSGREHRALAGSLYNQATARRRDSAGEARRSWLDGDPARFADGRHLTRSNQTTGGRRAAISRRASRSRLDHPPHQSRGTEDPRSNPAASDHPAACEQGPLGWAESRSPTGRRAAPRRSRDPRPRFCRKLPTVARAGPRDPGRDPPIGKYS